MFWIERKPPETARRLVHPGTRRPCLFYNNSCIPSIHLCFDMFIDPDILCVVHECRWYLAQKVRYCDITYSFLLMVAIFDLSVTRMSGSVHTSPAVLLDPENVGVAFGISLPSCIEAEILRYFICTSGSGGHLWVTSYPDVGECSHYFCCVAGPRK